MFYTQAWAKPTYVGTRLNHERRHISSMVVGWQRRSGGRMITATAAAATITPTITITI